jgi:hypothetical protein
MIGQAGHDVEKSRDAQVRDGCSDMGNPRRMLSGSDSRQSFTLIFVPCIDEHQARNLPSMLAGKQSHVPSADRRADQHHRMTYTGCIE